MPFTILISAFIIGLTGSFHCVGMCGPIALSVSGKSQSKFLSSFLYLSGKTITYIVIGLVFGLFGRQLKLAGLQQWLSVFAGIMLLLVVSIMLFNPLKYHENKLSAWISTKLLPLFGKVMQHRSAATPLYLGMLNGLLPCGLVYLGVVGSLATGSIINGGLFMLAFGIGTMPVMLSFLMMAKQFSIQYRQAFQKMAPVLISCLAVLLILRGLNLGIPYLSPSLPSMPVANNGEAISCH